MITEAYIDPKAVEKLLRSLLEIRQEPNRKPPPLIESMLNQGELVIVTGQWDSFKSRFAAEMARAVASGEPFLGQFGVTEPGPALIVQREIHPGFYDERIIDLCIGLPDELGLFVSYDEDFRFSPGYGKLIAEWIRNEGFRLIVFDPLTYFWPAEKSFDENAATLVSQVLGPILKLRKQNVTFVLVHHDPKPSDFSQGVARGSSVLVNAPDVRILLQRERDSDTVTVRCRSRNLRAPRRFRAMADAQGRLYHERARKTSEISQGQASTYD